MTGELSLGGNKITVLRDPTSAEDAANKQYVVAGDTSVDNKLSTLRTEYDANVNQFARLRRNYQKTYEAAEKFFGTPLTVDMKLTDISKSLTDINTRLGVVRDSKSFSDLIAGLQVLIGNIDKRLKDAEKGIKHVGEIVSLIKIPEGVAPDNIVNVSYVVSEGNATWSQQNNTIKYTATATEIYRLSVLSAAKFKIFTRLFLLRHDTDNNLSGVVSVVINKGTEETFTLEAKERTVTSATYYYCLEFVAETPQLVTA